MKPILKTTMLLFGFILCMNSLKAQTKLSLENKPISRSIKPFEPIKLSVEDSLYRELDDAIYGTYYYSPYSSNNRTPVFTILKVDLDWDGKVTGMHFSDSANSTFVKAWVNKQKEQDEKATIERYAKVKGYKSVSLLIPVSYETDLPNSNKYYTNDYFESYLKFDKKAFTGNSIMLAPIIIKVLTRGNG